MPKKQSTVDLDEMLAQVSRAGSVKKQSMGNMMGDLEQKLQPPVRYTQPSRLETIHTKKVVSIIAGATLALATATVTAYFGIKLVSSIDFGKVNQLLTRPTKQEVYIPPTSTIEEIIPTSTPHPLDICSNSNYSCEPTTWNLSLPTISTYFTTPITLTGYVAPGRKLKLHYEILEPTTNYSNSYGNINLCHQPENISFTISGPGIKDSIPGANSSRFTISGHTSYDIEIDTAKGGDYKILFKNYEGALECPDTQVILTISEGIWSK